MESYVGDNKTFFVLPSFLTSIFSFIVSVVLVTF